MSGSAVLRARACAALAAVALFASGAAAQPVAPTGPRYTREQMEAALATSPPFRFVYGTRDPATAGMLRERAMLVARRVFGADSSRVSADRDVAETDLGASGVMLLGSPRENEWTRRLAPSLPVTFTATGFRWQGTVYERSGDALTLSYPNPLAPRRFLVVVAGNSPAALARHGSWLPEGEDWRITREGEVARSGRFAQGSAQPWRYDASLDRDREAERARFAAALVAHGGAPLVVRSPAKLAATPVRETAVALLARLDALGLAAPPRSPSLSLTLYRSLEEKGAMSRDTRPEHLAVGAAHAALPAGRFVLDLWSVAAARLVQLGATSESRFLEPAGVWLSGRFEGEPLEREVARLYDGRILPSAAEAATPDADFRSPLIWTPARALLARAVFERSASRRAGLLALLRADAPGTLDSLCLAARAEPNAVTARYRQLADSLARTGRASLATARPRPWRPTDGFMRGVCLTHVVSLERGYLSRDAAETLAELQKAEASWVALTPFAYLPERGVPRLYTSALGGPDEETDEAVCEAAARARALGLRTWLAPQLWARGWSGDIAFAPEDWPRFFDRWRELVLHWALLAERERIDGLVVGHEMASATARSPERWRSLIADVRAVYTGTLTYEAAWDEVDHVPFWDALDLIGVSFSHPLAGAPTTDPKPLQAGADKALVALVNLAKRFGRPVLLAEVGVAAVPQAAVRPWEEGGGALDVEAQAACDAAIVEALDRHEWVAGAFWRRWPTSTAGQRAAEPSFSPRGRPAEQIVKSSLSRWVGRPVHIPPAGSAR